MGLFDTLGITTPTNYGDPNYGSPGYLSGQPAANSLTGMIDSFTQQNLSPSDIFNFAGSIPQTVGGIPGIGSRIPGLSRVPIPVLSQLSNIFALPNMLRFGASGSWESVHYADDLNAHHPKFKFLFKVTFSGFIGGASHPPFSAFVTRCDRPKVRLNHTDVNYYNFRTRVLTSVTYEPLSMSFLDEIGNSVNSFFVAYLAQRSGTGRGNYGIDKGFGDASSSLPYSRGYTEQLGQRIVLEQIFANGTMTNRFIFINPRIESFDFDELSMEDSNNGSLMNLTFSYDALECYTVYGSVEYTWGQTDLLRGGGTSGMSNGGQSSLWDNGGMGAMSVDGRNINGSPRSTSPADVIYNAVKQGADMLVQVPNSLSGLVGDGLTAIGGLAGGVISSAGDVISSVIEGTLGAIKDGSNMTTGANVANGDDAWANSKPFGSTGLLTGTHNNTVSPAEYFGETSSSTAKPFGTTGLLTDTHDTSVSSAEYFGDTP